MPAKLEEHSKYDILIKKIDFITIKKCTQNSPKSQC
jgi:hypothetical protein